MTDPQERAARKAFLVHYGARPSKRSEEWLSNKTEEMSVLREILDHVQTYRLQEEAFEEGFADGVEWARQNNTDLLNLLARIHRDGGHYVQKMGLARAVADADKLVAELYALKEAHQGPVAQRKTPVKRPK